MPWSPLCSETPFRQPLHKDCLQLLCSCSACKQFVLLSGRANHVSKSPPWCARASASQHRVRALKCLPCCTCTDCACTYAHVRGDIQNRCKVGESRASEVKRTSVSCSRRRVMTTELVTFIPMNLTSTFTHVCVSCTTQIGLHYLGFKTRSWSTRANGQIAQEQD